MRFIITCTLLFCIITTSKALDITFRIVDSIGTPVQKVVVSLHHAATKAILKNAITDTTGLCVFTKIPEGSYFLTAPAATTAVFSVNEKDTVQTLVLRTRITALAGVTITAAKPLISTGDGSITYNVENDPSLAGLSAAEAFAKVPFINVDGNGSIQLKGQSSFKILLNGKQTSMFANSPGDVLKSFPANIISKIEVITNPSAKYEGEGITGLINIITKKKVAGYNGSSSFSYNTTGQINPNTSFNLKYGKIGLTSFVYYARNTGLNTHGSQQYTSPFTTRHAADTGKTSGYMLGGNLELSYEPDSFQTISLYGRLTNSGKETRQQSNFLTLNESGHTLQESIYRTTEDADAPGGEFGMDYLKKYRKPEQSLSVNFNMQTAQQRSILNSNTTQDHFLVNNVKAKNLQTSFQADYTIPLSKPSKLEVGTRAIFRRVSSVYTSRDKDQQDPDNSGQLKYKQNVFGVYTVYTHKFSGEGLTLKAGGRLERTVVDGHFISNNTNVNQDYYSFLPSFSLNKTLPNNKQLSLAYNRRLARPGLTFLNPYADNRDPLFITFGNERLKPEFANNIESSFSSFSNKISYSIALNGSFTGSGIQRFLLFNEGTGVTTQTYDNIGKSNLWGLNGFVSLTPNKQLTVSLNLNANYVQIKNTANANERNSGIYGSVSSAINYTPAEKVMLFSNISYTASPVQLQGKNGDYLFYNVGGGYWLHKKKLMVTAALINFMGKYWRMDSAFESSAFQQKTTVYRPAGAISLGLRYNFGKLKENTSRKKGVTIDDTKADVNSR